MCIIVYKPQGVEFPKKSTFQTCFENNPDGAGYMYSYKDRVYIKKGFQSFSKFWESLQKTRKEVGDIVPYVLHFRISTQAGVRPDCTHPFPLSKKMEDMRLLALSCGIGIAHNGVISLTSHGYNKTITYSDTMEFITDYLALIIKTRTYYKDADTLELIKRLAGSKLAILDGTGHCELVGTFEQSGGVWYSNSSYKAVKYAYTSGYWDNYYYDLKSDKWELKQTAKPSAKSSGLQPVSKISGGSYYGKYYDYTKKVYVFPSGYCPYYIEGTTKYCKRCFDKDMCGIADSVAPQKETKADDIYDNSPPKGGD